MGPILFVILSGVAVLVGVWAFIVWVSRLFETNDVGTEGRQAPRFGERVCSTREDGSKAGSLGFSSLRHGIETIKVESNEYSLQVVRRRGGRIVAQFDVDYLDDARELVECLEHQVREEIAGLLDDQIDCHVENDVIETSGSKHRQIVLLHTATEGYQVVDVRDGVSYGLAHVASEEHGHELVTLLVHQHERIEPSDVEPGVPVMRHRAPHIAEVPDLVLQMK